MKKEHLSFILSENADVRQKITALIEGWLDGGEKALTDEDTHLEFYIENADNSNNKLFFPESCFEKPAFFIRMVSYFEDGYPLKGGRARTIDSIIKESCEYLGDKILATDAAGCSLSDGPDNICVKICLTARTQFGAVKDYYNEKCMSFAF